MGAPAKKDGKATSGFHIMGGGKIGEGAALATTEFEKSVPADEIYGRLRTILCEQYGATPKA